MCNLPAVDGVNGPDDYIGACGDEAMARVFTDAQNSGAAVAHYDYGDGRFEVNDRGVAYLGPPDKIPASDGNTQKPRLLELGTTRVYVFGAAIWGGGMKLDFLDVLSQPATKVEGHSGTQGTTSVHAGCGVPPTVPLNGTTRDNFSAAEADTGICPPMSPSCPLPQKASAALNYAAVPLVSQCPAQNGGVLISRWLRNGCARSWQAWASEKSLWADYCAWCEQNKQPACRRELFRETMNQSFSREDDGWQGVALAIDLLESKYVM